MDGERTCITCGTTEPFEPLYEQHGLSLVRCPRCGLVFQHPAPSEAELLGSYYHDEAFTEALFGEFREITLRNARHKLELLGAYGVVRPGLRALDVGASSGAWLEVAAGAGIEATGVELGAETARRARERGLDVRTGTLGEVADDLPQGGFDLITFWDVLEHLPDPREELRTAAGLLAPGGRVAATFPNVEGLYPRLTRRLLTPATGIWEHPERPHLYDFSPTTAGMLFAAAGLRTHAVRTFATPYGFLRETRLTPELTGAGLRGRLVRGAFAGLRLVAYPIARASGSGNAMFILSVPAA